MCTPTLPELALRRCSYLMMQAKAGAALQTTDIAQLLGIDYCAASKLVEASPGLVLEEYISALELCGVELVLYIHPLGAPVHSPDHEIYQLKKLARAYKQEKAKLLQQRDAAQEDLATLQRDYQETMKQLDAENQKLKEESIRLS